MSARSITRRLPLVLASAAALSLLIVACSGDNDSGDDGPMVLTPVSGDYNLQVISQDLAVGENRVVIGLLDNSGMPIAGADLEADFYPEGEDTPVADSGLEAVTVQRSFTHIHEDGEQHQHEVGEIGVYVTNVDFDTAGTWSVVASGMVDGEDIESLGFTFSVREESLSPAIGEPAPQSVQLTLDDVDDILQIDTSTVPNPDMHDTTIAEAVTSGQPTVIVFATPAFCVSQICGPTKEVVDQMYEQYGDRMNFVHVEPYDVVRARSGDCQPLTDCIVPFLVEEWGLQSEPWVFTVDAEGNIAGKFEGVVGETELDQHLQTLVS